MDHKFINPFKGHSVHTDASLPMAPAREDLRKESRQDCQDSELLKIRGTLKHCLDFQSIQVLFDISCHITYQVFLVFGTRAANLGTVEVRVESHKGPRFCCWVDTLAGVLASVCGPSANAGHLSCRVRMPSGSFEKAAYHVDHVKNSIREDNMKGS